MQSIQLHALMLYWHKLLDLLNKEANELQKYYLTEEDRESYLDYIATSTTIANITSNLKNYYQNLSKKFHNIKSITSNTSGTATMTSKSNFNRLDNIDETTTQLDFFTSNNSKIINENIIQNKVNMFSNIFKDYDSTSIIYENVTNKIHENDEYLFNNS